MYWYNFSGQTGVKITFTFTMLGSVLSNHIVKPTGMDDEDGRNTLDAARLAAASSDFDALERAGLQLVGLARRRRVESNQPD
jgi:hypothetical protein